MSNTGYSKVLKLKYKVVEWKLNKPSVIIFEDNVTYNSKELAVVAQMDYDTKIECHKIKKMFDGMLLALNQVL